MSASPIWKSPRDWATGDRLRARDLNEELAGNVEYLRKRVIDVVTVYPGSDIAFSDNSVFTGLGEVYQLKILLPEQANVLLMLSPGTIRSSGTETVYFDWKRDGKTFLSSLSLSPATTGLFVARVTSATSAFRGGPLLWWDVDVPAGEHTYDLFGKGTHYFDVSDTPLQLTAIGL